VNGEDIREGIVSMRLGALYRASRLAHWLKVKNPEAPAVRLSHMAERRRFPPPWTVEESEPCFIARDKNGQAFAWVYCEDEPGKGVVQ
jgi:hypothetical protein